MAKRANWGRAAVMAAAAALIMTSVAPTPGFARAPEKRTTVGASDTTDISARRRAYRGNGGAAAAAAVAGIIGTGVAIAAANSRPYYYDRGYGYYGGPGYYGGGGYYGRPGYGYYGGGYGTKAYGW